MNVGIISDIHANLAALEAVLARSAEEDCEALVCCGDVVGYGASPAECVAIMRQREIPCVLGNHDHYVTLLMDPRLERLRDDIKRSVQWTQNELDMGALRWLAELPRKIDFETFSIVHGSFGPKPWVYLTNEKTFRHNFKYQEYPLAFCGHSHIPLVATQNPETETPTVGYLKSMQVPTDRKVMINVGSVGQPRDHDPRAACAVLDLDSLELHGMRVPYDIEATQALMRAADMPVPFIERLDAGR